MGSVTASIGAGAIDTNIADLIFLVNPAAKSIQAKQFVEFLDRNKIKLYRVDQDGKRYERPLIVSVTSRGDIATRLAFPAALYLRSIFGNFRQYGAESCLPFKADAPGCRQVKRRKFPLRNLAQPTKQTTPQTLNG